MLEAPLATALGLISRSNQGQSHLGKSCLSESCTCLSRNSIWSSRARQQVRVHENDRFPRPTMEQFSGSLQRPKIQNSTTMSHVQQQAVKDNGGVSIFYPMLTPLNYTVWAIKTEAILDAQGVWEAVEPAEEAQVDAKKDKKARAYILQCIPEDIILQIAKKKTTKEIWESIKTRHLGSERVKKARVQTLRSEFDALRMKEIETIDEFTGKLSAMTSKFSTLGVALEDSFLVKKLLDSVPDKYFPIVTEIEQFHDLETMPFEEAIGRMKTYEERKARLSGNTNSTEGQLMLTHAEWKARQKRNNGENASGNKGRGSSDYHRGKWRGRGRGRGRGTSRHNSAGGTSNTGSGTRDKSHIRCFACDKIGHYASECRSKGRDNEAHLICATNEEPALMMTISQEGTHTRRVQEDAVLLSEERLLPETYRNNKNGESVNDNKKIPEFTIMDPFYSNEANDVTNGETRTKNVTPPEATEIPTGGEASPSTYSPTTHEADSPQVTSTPVCFRSLADIYANTEEVVGIEEEENEVMMVVSEEPTCYQEAATEALWYEAMEKELKSIEKNNTWSPSELQKDINPLV
ncbi:hypothetical protein V6N13_099346 [Hibiscus sabdariffa]